MCTISGMLTMTLSCTVTKYNWNGAHAPGSEYANHNITNDEDFMGRFFSLTRWMLNVRVSVSCGV